MKGFNFAKDIGDFSDTERKRRKSSDSNHWETANQDKRSSSRPKYAGILSKIYIFIMGQTIVFPYLLKNKIMYYFFKQDGIGKVKIEMKKRVKDTKKMAENRILGILFYSF